ncbi:MAG: alpha-ribazole phosphatase [Candidatus Omnitrophica bacterium]|nr:alpha-ribazole phosphatase [Candidatus Omnitrophota bacterium]
MKLFLVRHGETKWVKEGRYQGSTDVPLNSGGAKQARALARLLKKEAPLAVYSSRLGRARETARYIAKACGKKVVSDPRLNEVSFGEWEGEFHREIATRFPERARRWYSGKWTSRPPGGESLRSLGKRVGSFLNDFSKRFGTKKGSCVVVTHGGPIRMFLIQVLGIDPEIFWSVRVDPASITVIQIRPKGNEIALVNSQAHLNGLKRDIH